MYGNGDLLLFPSIFDNDGLAVLEAGQNNTPALVLADTGVSERITNNQNGFIVENNLQAYAERIYQIVNNEKLLKQVSNNANNLKAQTWQKVALEYQSLFWSLTNNIKN